jgi:MMP 1-O-methyltransferase
MQVTEIKSFIDSVKGFLWEDEGILLYNLAKNCKGDGVIVEIGSFKGKSTTWLGNGSKEGNNVKIYAIDPHTGSSEHQKEGQKFWTFDVFKENIKKAGVEDIITPLVMFSEEAEKDFKEPIEVLFIDGAHEYEYVKLDFELWEPKVINGGYIAMHDTDDSWTGPQRIAKDLMYKSGKFRHIRIVDSITCGKKVGSNTFFDKFMFHSYVWLDDTQKKLDKSLIKSLLKETLRVVRRVINKI